MVALLNSRNLLGLGALTSVVNILDPAASFAQGQRVGGVGDFLTGAFFGSSKQEALDPKTLQRGSMMKSFGETAQELGMFAVATKCRAACIPMAVFELFQAGREFLFGDFDSFDKFNGMNNLINFFAIASMAHPLGRGMFGMLGKRKGLAKLVSSTMSKLKAGKYKNPKIAGKIIARSKKRLHQLDQGILRHRDSIRAKYKGWGDFVGDVFGPVISGFKGSKLFAKG